MLSLEAAIVPDELAMAFADAIPTLIVGVIGGLFGLAVALINKRGTRESTFITQLQAQITQQAADITLLQQNQNASYRRERVRDDYIHLLRGYIADGKPPPPPDWPDELTR